MTQEIKSYLAPKQVYIATALENTAEFDHLRLFLRHAEIDVSYDWTRIPGFPPGTAAGNKEAMAWISREELRGVQDADFLVAILVPGKPQRGTHVEIGAALALGKQVILVGSEQAFRECAFYQHEQVMRVHKDEAGSWARDVRVLALAWYRVHGRL